MQEVRSERRREPDVDVERGSESPPDEGLELHHYDEPLQLRNGNFRRSKEVDDADYGFGDDFISRATNKSSWNDYDYSVEDKKTRQEEETRKRHHPHVKLGRRATEKAIEESSSFRCLASFQKFRNFSMYFILSHLAGYSCVAFMGVNIVVQLVMIVIGLIYLDNCPLEPRLSTWNICAGIAFTFKMFTAMMFLAVMRKDIHLTGGVPEKTTIYKSPRYFCIFGIVDCVLVILLILGMTLTMPHIGCMADKLADEPLKQWAECPVDGKEKAEGCYKLNFFFSVAAMVFLETVYAVGYLLSLWVSGCFYTVGVAEEAAGKVIKGYAKLRNQSSWNIKAEDQKILKRKAARNQDKKRKKKSTNMGLLKRQKMRRETQQKIKK